MMWNISHCGAVEERIGLTVTCWDSQSEDSWMGVLGGLGDGDQRDARGGAYGRESGSLVGQESRRLISLKG